MFYLSSVLLPYQLLVDIFPVCFPNAIIYLSREGGEYRERDRSVTCRARNRKKRKRNGFNAMQQIVLRYTSWKITTSQILIAGIFSSDSVTLHSFSYHVIAMM